MLTLGLVLPWREAALERYKMRHCYYGDLQGSFEGRGWEFFKRGWWLWLLAVVPLIVVLAVLPLSAYVSAATGAQPHRAAVFVLLLMLLLAPFIYGAFKAMEWRWWLSGIRFGDVRLESTSAARGAGRPLLESDRLVPADCGAFAPICSACAALIASMSGTPIAKFFTAGAICREAFRCWCWR